jgi:hypothetical protein
MKRITVRFTETAAVLGADKYKWFKYTGKSKKTVGTKKTTVINPGDVYGVRPSTGGKEQRLVTKTDGLTKVYTIDEAQGKSIGKVSTAARAPKLTAGPASPKPAPDAKVTTKGPAAAAAPKADAKKPAAPKGAGFPEFKSSKKMSNALYDATYDALMTEFGDYSIADLKAELRDADDADSKKALKQIIAEKQAASAKKPSTPAPKTDAKKPATPASKASDKKPAAAAPSIKSLTELVTKHGTPEMLAWFKKQQISAKPKPRSAADLKKYDVKKK